MDKKTIIGIFVVVGAIVGYRYFTKKNKSVIKKDYTNSSMATSKDGMEFYNKISSQGNWGYSEEGVKAFVDAYTNTITKGKHNQLIDILNSNKEKRSASEVKMVDDTLESILSKLKPQ